MAYTSPKTGAVINPGKRKKLPKNKVSKKTQKKNRKKIAKNIVHTISGLNTVKFGVGMVEDAKHGFKVLQQKKRRRSLIAKKNAVKKSNKKK